MKIVFAGIGGVGGVFGGYAARDLAGHHDVIFFCRGEKLRVIGERGINVTTSEGSFTARPSSVLDRPEGIADAVFICSKAYSLMPLAEAVVPMIGPSTLVIPLQNGLESYDALSAVLPPCRLKKGCVYVFATMTAPGSVELKGPAKRLIFGPRDEPSKWLAEAMDMCDFDTLCTDSIEQEQWTKFCRISSLAGVTSLYRCTVLEVGEDPHKRIVARSLMDEVYSMAASHGVRITDEAMEDIKSSVDRAPQGATSSMCADVKKGNRTEIETLIGYMCREGEKMNIPVPTYRRIYEELKKQGVC